jgi:DNA polymerase-3 subunit delta
MGIHLLTGDDESLVRSKVLDLVTHLVGDGERSLMVDEFDGDDYELRSVVDAAQTLPFLTDRRVVVARDVGRFTTDELTALLGYLADPLDTTDLVLAGGGGRLAKKLTDAVVAAGGHLTDTNPPRKGTDRAAWIRAEGELHGVRIDPQAAARIAERLGDDMGRVDGIVAVLRSTFGEGVRVTVADIEPFLGDAGDVPPWDFTDAIDSGQTAAALTMMSRMMHGGDRHPLQIMAILHNHYSKLARLDGVDARGESDVAQALGIKPGFPARKALGNYQRLGGAGVKRAIALLAAADLDLRGATDLDDETVMEVLVARLSKLTPARR